jgi:hypothetical protein
MQDSRPSNFFPYTIFAGMTVAEAERVGTDEPVVVKRLHDRNAALPAGVVDRGGKLGEEIVDVNDFRPKAGDFAGGALPGGAGVNAGEAGAQGGSGSGQKCVVGFKQRDFVAPVFQQLFFCLDNYFFATGDLVAVMDLQDSHGPVLVVCIVSVCCIGSNARGGHWMKFVVAGNDN